MSKRDRFGLIGNTIAGTFRVDEVVAEGGFGVVYRAFHLHFRSPVALKCLKIPGELSAAERKDFLEQFRSEAEIQFHLSSSLPHIVRPLSVDSVSTDSGEFIPIMALEWLEGKSFEKIIEQRAIDGLAPMRLDDAMELISPAVQALHEAHNFRIGGEDFSVIHRDIKPDNFFVTKVGEKEFVKLLDFGISKVRRAATQLAGHASQTGGQAPFSPAYGAPEQWVPKRFGQTGPWTDVWGLALTLVEIIKGDAVIVGDHQAMMGTTLDPKKRPTPRSEGVQVSHEIEGVFSKAMALDPRYRYQSIRDFWDALARAIALSPQPSEYDTPSGRRVRLPSMRAPTPWTPPHKRQQGPLKHLPPMLAPAPLRPTLSEELKGDIVVSESHTPSSYPSDPNSDLHPVPAAPTPWQNYDEDIPPISDDTERLPLHDDEPMDPPLIAPLSEKNPYECLFENPSHSALREDSLKLELQPTSAFPELAAAEPLLGISAFAAGTREDMLELEAIPSPAQDETPPPPDESESTVHSRSAIYPSGLAPEIPDLEPRVGGPDQDRLNGTDRAGTGMPAPSRALRPPPAPSATRAKPQVGKKGASPSGRLPPPFSGSRGKIGASAGPARREPPPPPRRQAGGAVAPAPEPQDTAATGARTKVHVQTKKRSSTGT